MPGRSIQTVLNSLEQHMAAEDLNLCHSTHKLVIGSLVARSKGQRDKERQVHFELESQLARVCHLCH